MNLTSCDNCATVLDKDKMYFPSYIWKDDGSGGNMIDEEKATFNGEFHTAHSHCPVCQSKILKEEL